MQDRAFAYLSTSLAGRTDVELPDPDDITVTGAEGAPGSGVTVTLSTGVQIITPLIQPFLTTSPVPVSSSLTMRIQ